MSAQQKSVFGWFCQLFMVVQQIASSTDSFYLRCFTTEKSYVKRKFFATPDLSCVWLSSSILRLCPQHPLTCRTTPTTSFLLRGCPASCYDCCSATRRLKMVLWRDDWWSVWRPSSTKPKSHPNPRRFSTPMPRMPSYSKPSLSSSTMTGAHCLHFSPRGHCLKWSAMMFWLVLSVFSISLLYLNSIHGPCFSTASRIFLFGHVTSWGSSYSTERPICATWPWKACAPLPALSFPMRQLKRI